MCVALLIVGQGLAGTLLAWELEQANVPFSIADAGHDAAASRVAAGIINPITGRRLVPSWRAGELLPGARAVYRALEAALGVPLWRDLRVRRLFADQREQRVFREKHARGELAPFVEAADESGFWIRGAARVDVAVLLRAARQRWREKGWLQTRAVDVAREAERDALVIDCTGLTAVALADFAFVPWEFSKGELLELEVEGLAPDVVLNRRHWVLPVEVNAAWVGATHEPGIRDARPTPAARAALETSARELLARPYAVSRHRAGIRVNVPDKRPVAGRHPRHPHLGLINGLGAKGALWAPLLAREWRQHLVGGAAFDPAVDVARFPGA